MQTKIGDPFAPAALRDDVRSIFALGFFDDVQLRTEEFEGGIRVIFVVVERPLLREVSFEGNSELSTDALREKAAIRIGVLYNPVEVQRAQEAIREKYEDEGFFGVQITPRTERTPEGDLRVVFRIEEGPKLHIDRIVIEGNKALSASQIKDSLQTRERLYWIFPFSTVQRRVFDDDVERILQLYGDHGYLQARVDSHEMIPDLDRKKVTLRIRVVEGPQFQYGHHHDHRERSPLDRGGAPPGETSGGGRLQPRGARTRCWRSPTATRSWGGPAPRPIPPPSTTWRT